MIKYTLRNVNQVIGYYKYVHFWQDEENDNIIEILGSDVFDPPIAHASTVDIARARFEWDKNVEQGFKRI